MKMKNHNAKWRHRGDWRNQGCGPRRKKGALSVDKTNIKRQRVQAILAEIHDIRERTIANTRLKVGSPGWNKAVQQCVKLRRELKRYGKSYAPSAY